MHWNAERYVAVAAFVPQMASSLVDVLDPRPGEHILDLGCGWGSFTVHAARRFPNSPITAVSNSRSQRAFIEAQARQRAGGQGGGGTFGNGPFNRFSDFTNWDRCITRGLMGSLLPTIYNNGNEIVQGPGYVVIRNEMIHEARVVPLDGRPHPPEEAPHTWMGFSTGEWQGSVLKVRTTHIKQGWHRRNGVPMSARTTMTEYFFRHGNVLTQMSITEDPVFLTEPLVKSQEFVRSQRELPAGTWLWVCDPVVEIASQEPGAVPAPPCL